MKIKEIKIVNQDESTEIADIGADAVNVDYNNTTVKDELDRLNAANDSLRNTQTNQSTTLTSLQSQVSSLASGGPAGGYATVAALTSADPDHSKIYVVVADGHWYYYNSGWKDGGLYQATSIGENTISYKMLDDFLKNTVGITVPTVEITTGAYLNGSAIINQYGFSYTSPIYLKKGQRIYAIVKGYSTAVSLLVKSDSEGNNRRALIQSTNANQVVINYVAGEDMYVMLCSTSNTLSYYYVDENTKYKLENLKDIVINETNNIDFGTITNNTYINNAGNVISHPYGSYSSTDYININPSKNYKLKGINWEYTDPIGYAFYDNNKNFISFVRNPVANDYDITSPSNAYYIRLTLRTSRISLTDFYLVTDFIEIENEISEINNEIEQINTNEKFDLFRSFNKFGVIGDSLASGESVGVSGGQAQYVDNYNYSWGQFIAKKYGMTCINFSAGGLTTRSWLTGQLSRLRNSDNKCNAYIIALGVNDYTLGSEYIGTSSDININDFTQNADTFYGNYGKIIGNIKDIQPKAKIFLFTIPDQTPNPTRDYSALNTAIRTIATLFTNVYLIDLANDYNNYYTTGFIYNNMRGGHYNAISYDYMAELLYKWISDYMISHYQDFKQIEFIGTNYEY